MEFFTNYAHFEANWAKLGPKLTISANSSRFFSNAQMSSVKFQANSVKFYYDSSAKFQKFSSKSVFRQTTWRIGRNIVEKKNPE